MSETREAAAINLRVSQTKYTALLAESGELAQMTRGFSCGPARLRLVITFDPPVTLAPQTAIVTELLDETPPRPRSRWRRWLGA